MIFFRVSTPTKNFSTSTRGPTKVLLSKLFRWPNITSQPFWQDQYLDAGMHNFVYVAEPAKALIPTSSAKLKSRHITPRSPVSGFWVYLSRFDKI
jgi:hypothetical protein